MQALPFVQTRREEKQFFEKMNTIDDLIIKVQQRLERLLFSKEKGILEIQLASEELKRLVDKELEKQCEELQKECEKHEHQLKSLKKALEDVRYTKHYTYDSLLEKMITNKDVGDQLLLEPLDFQLITEPILRFLPKMVSFFYREIEAVNSRIVHPDYTAQSLTVYQPLEPYSHTKTVPGLKITRGMGCCVLPDGSLFLCGGRGEKGSMKTSLKLDPSLNSVCEIQEMHSARDCFALAYSNSFIYAFGGWDYSTRQALKTCEKFDLRTEEWCEIRDMKEAKCNTTCVLANDLFYIAGKGSKIIEKYDCTYDSFTSLSLLLHYDAPARLLPSIDNSLLVLISDKLTAFRLDTEEIVMQFEIPFKNWSGVCSPILNHNTVYFLENKSYWKYDLTSHKLDKIQ